MNNKTQQLHLAPFHPRIMVKRQEEKARQEAKLYNRMVSRIKKLKRIVLPNALEESGTLIFDPRHERHYDIDKSRIKKNIKLLIVLFGFSDQKFKQKKSHYERLFFSKNLMRSGSVRDYYREVSGGRIDITGDVIDGFTSDKRQRDYTIFGNGGAGGIEATGKPGPPDLAEEIIHQIPEDFDFKPYINRCSSNQIDGIILVHAGFGRETSSKDADIHSHQTSTRTPINRRGGVIRTYAMIPEICNIGICCHEIGHLIFDLFDLYDKDGKVASIGNWGLMGTGCWNGGGLIPAHMSAWSKAQLGWVEVKTPNTAKKGHRLNEVKSRNKEEVLRLWTKGMNGNEYFLVEYREATPGSYDEFLPGSGLLVWHIDESASPNRGRSHRKVVLEQADGLSQLEQDVKEITSNFGDLCDPFKSSSAKTAFNHSTSPSSNSYTNEKSNVSIGNIVINNGCAVFDYII